jgi:CheY-like chemotaxis protein
MKPYRLAGKKWILVMENDNILQMVTRRILEKAGYGVYVTDNGDETIECYRIAKYCGYHFTAVILDLNTPHGKGGVETIRQLREIDPEVRAIISTGNVSDPAIMNYREYGFRSALAKPFKPKELKQAIHDVL